MSKSPGPLHWRTLLGGIVVTVVGGIILYIVVRGIIEPTYSLVTPTTQATVSLSETPEIQPTYTKLATSVSTLTPTAEEVTIVPSQTLMPKTIPIQKYANEESSKIWPSLQLGDRVLGDQPKILFSIPSGLNTIHTQCTDDPNADHSYMNRPKKIRVPVHISEVASVHVLLNAGNTYLKKGAVGKIELFFLRHEKPLVTNLTLGQNIREWRPELAGTSPDSISDLNVQEVFSDPSTLDGPGVLDMLTINVDQPYRSEELQEIVIYDQSQDLLGSPDPCLIIAGITLMVAQD